MKLPPVKVSEVVKYAVYMPKATRIRPNGKQVYLKHIGTALLVRPLREPK